ncbi:LacI family DNA-binding transcriptional regulator [Rariglobus hedericola]|uniref:LacI family DNA-binding transcriptional regulator n=1 Tax=Rariglobus hedericola TaxID=2597822 RepID=UPI0013968AAF|nr:LacI family DNA-binding transcriptional regulator [Rariglobus hedericola]
MSDAPTIRDLADKLGLGKSTVQRALAGLSGISPATARRVQAVAAEMGYRPDPLFSSLAMQRSRSRRHTLEIAYLRSSNARGGLNPFEQVKAHAFPLGYDVQMIDPEALGVGKRLMKVLYHRGNVGVIVAPVNPSCHEAILANTQLPVVCCGRIDPLPLHTVQPDITDHVRVVWRHIRAAGYSRIGPAIAQHTPAVEDDIDRLGAVLACQLELRTKDRIPPLLTPLPDHASLVAWFRRHKPDAILGFSAGQYYALKQAGIDMSRIGFASLHASHDVYTVNIAGTEELNDSVAQEAVHLLDQFIRRRAVGLPREPLHLLIPGRWKPGSSLPNKARRNLASA